MAIPKEPHFFTRLGQDPTLPEYAEFYRHAKDERFRGDASPSYLFYPYVPKRIVEAYPKASILAILREPIERAHSAWWHHRAAGFEALDFSSAVKVNLREIENLGPVKVLKEEWRGIPGRSLLARRTYIERGYYAAQLRRYLALFPQDQLLVLLLEDLQSSPGHVATRLWKFLGLDPIAVELPRVNRSLGPFSQRAVRLLRATGLLDHVPRRLRRLGRTGLARIDRRNRPAIPPKVLNTLRFHYREHNLQLEELLQRDLASWS